jgi:hypothetical protein
MTRHLTVKNTFIDVDDDDEEDFDMPLMVPVKTCPATVQIRKAIFNDEELSPSPQRVYLSSRKGIEGNTLRDSDYPERRKQSPQQEQQQPYQPQPQQQTELSPASESGAASWPLCAMRPPVAFEREASGQAGGNGTTPQDYPAGSILDPSQAAERLSQCSEQPVLGCQQRTEQRDRPVWLAPLVMPVGFVGFPSVSASVLPTAKPPSARHGVNVSLSNLVDVDESSAAPPDPCPADIKSLEKRQPEWSRGALFHSTGMCKPCGWYWKPQGCGSGKDCCHCHLCPKGTLKARRRTKFLMRCVAEGR